MSVILNNNYLGMVRQWQSFFYEHRFSHTDLTLQPDFIKLINLLVAWALEWRKKASLI